MLKYLLYIPKLILARTQCCNQFIIVCTKVVKKLNAQGVEQKEELESVRKGTL